MIASMLVWSIRFLRGVPFFYRHGIENTVQNDGHNAVIADVIQVVQQKGRSLPLPLPAESARVVLFVAPDSTPAQCDLSPTARKQRVIQECLTGSFSSNGQSAPARRRCALSTK